jgi:monovalent cation:H+ antiporter-2, CPA2 family
MTPTRRCVSSIACAQRVRSYRLWRARDPAASARLLKAGATHAYPDAVEASLRLGALALEMLHVGGEDINSIIQDVRSSNYKPILDKEQEK